MNIRKLIYTIWLAMIIATICYGAYESRTYTDNLIGAGEEKFSVFQSSYYLEYEYGNGQDLSEIAENCFSKADLIAKVKYLGVSECESGEVIFYCNIEEVYKGNNKLKGTKIRYVCEPFSLDYCFGFSWGSYVNYMKQDEEYLIFAQPLNAEFSALDEDLYMGCAPDFLHYFSFKDHSDTPVSLTPLTAEDYENFLGVDLNLYPEQEFFATNEQALASLKEIKRIIFSRLEELKS